MEVLINNLPKPPKGVYFRYIARKKQLYIKAGIHPHILFACLLWVWVPIYLFLMVPCGGKDLLFKLVDVIVNPIASYLSTSSLVIIDIIVSLTLLCLSVAILGLPLIFIIRFFRARLCIADSSLSISGIRTQRWDWNRNRTIQLVRANKRRGGAKTIAQPENTSREELVINVGKMRINSDQLEWINNVLVELAKLSQGNTGTEH